MFEEAPDANRAVNIKVDGHPINVGYFSYDALQVGTPHAPLKRWQLTVGKVLDDLCRLIDGEPLQFLRTKSLSPAFTLELIESILVNSGSLFVDHSELTQVLRTRLMPLIVRYLSERHTFPQTVRVARILLVLLKRHMSLLTAECEMALGLLIHLLEPDGTTPWKRVLSMEVFRGLYAEPGLVRLIYSLYDREEGRKNILKDHMASLVRLASEKPSLIGVGNQSTLPSRPEHSRSMTEEQITLEVGGVAGVIGTSVPSTEANVSGLSSQWSVVRIPYVDLLDKADAPAPPDTYIYSIVLNCISSLADGLAKFILPLTVPELKSKKKNRITSPDQVPGSARASHDLQSPNSLKVSQNLNSRKSPIPINPLESGSHHQLPAVKSCAGIIETCWPAILATCSTFLYAALDDEYYHHLVRSFQRLAHVAGLLRLSVPRDAFLTTLGKSAMPADSGNVKAPTAPAVDSPKSPTAERKRKDTNMSHGSSLPAESSNTPSESRTISLSTRNLLCMRALLNLGIALGPTLDQSAWSIILETLEHTDLMIGISSGPAAKANNAASDSGEVANPGSEVPKANIGTEIIAVRAASVKMLESTSDYPSDSFESILSALLNLSGVTERKISLGASTGEETSSVPSSPQQQRRAGHMHQNARRVSLTVGKPKMEEGELKFVLENANELSKANLERLSSLDENDRSAWQLLTDSLISSAAEEGIDAALRLKASKIVSNLVYWTMKQKSGDNDSERSARQLRNLQTLNMQVKSLYGTKPSSPRGLPATVVEIHEQCLDTLRNVLEQYAETFSDGWTIVFDLISSVFVDTGSDEDGKHATSRKTHSTSLLADSPRLVRAAYKSLHLIASDFLTMLPAPCRLELVDSFSSFASQQQDFNISLTTTSFFWNVSDFLQGEIEGFSIENQVDASVSEEALAALSKDDNRSISRNSLWLLLLLRIVDVTTDSRSEVRNSAVHTLLRIFDAYGQQLEPKAWRLCLNRVLFQMVDEVESELQRLAQDGLANSDEFKSWAETTVVMVKGSSELITNFFEFIVQDEEFDQSWERLLKSLHTLISLQRLDFSEATFSSLANILLRVQTRDGLSKQALQSAWSLWTNGHPASKAEMIDLEYPNQEAGLAYLRTLQQVYRLHSHELAEKHIEQILQHMRLLAWNSISPPYSPDMDRPSNLQAFIIDSIKAICLDKHESQPGILLCLADFVDSALTKWAPKNDSRKPTFVAFSKSAIDLLGWYIADFGIKKDIFSNGSLTTALEHLAAPIAQKYEWQGKDRERSLWQKATTASLNVLQVAVPYVEGQYAKSKELDISRFWECVVDISQGIVSASGYQIFQLPHGSILADESFDIASFNRLKTLIIPSLGLSAISNTIRRDFACALFLSSFIYPPQRFDLASASLENDPLKGIYDIRPGRTFDPPATMRPNMAYVLMDTMFELASKPHDTHSQSNGAQSPPLTSLARSISPYLILRCAASLRTYIADQPLRGLMPQPTPARKALLHLLRGMVRLQSEPAAIPEFPALKTLAVSGAAGGHNRKHLEWIYPLVVKAVQVAGKERDDGQVLQALGEVLETVGQGT